jgi:hypothetical protein
VLHIGFAELLILGALATMFLLPLVALVVWVIARGRKKPQG